MVASIHDSIRLVEGLCSFVKQLKKTRTKYSHCAPYSMVIYNIVSTWSQYSISQCSEFNVRYFVTKIGHPHSKTQAMTWNDLVWRSDTLLLLDRNSSSCFVSSMSFGYGYVAAPCCSFSIEKLRWPDNSVVRRKLINPYLSMCMTCPFANLRPFFFLWPI